MQSQWSSDKTTKMQRADSFVYVWCFRNERFVWYIVFKAWKTSWHVYASIYDQLTQFGVDKKITQSKRRHDLSRNKDVCPQLTDKPASNLCDVSTRKLARMSKSSATSRFKLKLFNNVLTATLSEILKIPHQRSRISLKIMICGWLSS